MDKKVNTSTIIGLAFFAILLLIVGFAVVGGAFNVDKDTTPQQNTQSQVQENKAEDKITELDLSVNISQDGLTITNNEAAPMTMCKLELNGDWETKRTLTPNQPLLIEYSSFVKSDGEKFNPYTHQTKDLLVNMCEGQTARYATFKSGSR